MTGTEINFCYARPVGAHIVRPRNTAVVGRAHNVRPYTRFFATGNLCGSKIDFPVVLTYDTIVKIRTKIWKIDR